MTKTKKTEAEISQLVGSKGFEFEGKEDLKERFANFVVGKVLSVEKHPNADRLRVAQVEVGKANGGPLQIVCGAPNLAAGQLVLVALVGAVLPTNTKIKIAKTKIRGVVSCGMICSETELGLGKDSSGIMVLEKTGKGSKLKAGMSLVQALGLEDTILDFDILPNRAHDCLSYEGMAREICAMEGRGFKQKEQKLKTSKNSQQLIEIKIVDKKLCPRYLGAVLDKIEVKPSPRWLQNRLIASGMEPINNVVDITNYVMLETGNPLHAFDFNQIADQKDKVELVIRTAAENEKLTLLDEKVLELTKNDLVVANGEKPLALAGIKGGKNSGINAETKRIVLEAANFNALNIRKTRQYFGLNTESQARFEKDITPQLAERAFLRAIELLEKYATAELLVTVDNNPTQVKTQTVKLELEQLEKLFGQKIKKETALKILKNLGFELTQKSANAFAVKAPYWRLDIEGQEDLFEEIGRVVGYEQIKEVPAVAEVVLPYQNETRLLEWQLKDLMTSQGFDEIKTYSFYSEKDAENMDIAKSKHWQIIAPSSEDLALMRLSLYPAMLKSVSLNAKHYDEFSLFEIGKIYQRTKTGDSAEKQQLIASVFNKSLSGEDLFLELKGALEAVLNDLGVNNFQFVAAQKDQLFQPGQLAQVLSKDGKVLAEIGVIKPAFAKKYSIKKTVAVMALDLEKVLALRKVKKEFKQLAKFPVVLRDLSFFVPKFTEAAVVEKMIKKATDKTLQELELFDLFWDKNKKMKSMAFHLSFGFEDKTMTSEEADERVGKVIKALEKAGFEMRVG